MAQKYKRYQSDEDVAAKVPNRIEFTLVQKSLDTQFGMSFVGVPECGTIGVRLKVEQDSIAEAVGMVSGLGLVGYKDAADREYTEEIVGAPLIADPLANYPRVYTLRFCTKALKVSHSLNALIWIRCQRQEYARTEAVIKLMHSRATKHVGHAPAKLASALGTVSLAADDDQLLNAAKMAVKKKRSRETSEEARERTLP
ncbi:hypothetical protein H310_01023 [Aphanomyces invadans]|uniref:Uncharacterized protein n=1 Tax=Aphanomyces invadans TaxID=157072 RepID=A0A024URH4_9STRA|nr:hypothetical protein H310_01023 [Aphanomyces invadans]ETW08442.1 hypothetical protein H310_01023 [Aphanomyces invadans]|eukprot:XP_008862247.1 hypothetical protein H310_01023 [Aphanomyces invadans]